MSAEKIKEIYREFVLVQYDAEKSTLPERKRTKVKSEAKPQNLANHFITGTGVWKPDNDFLDDEAILAAKKVGHVELQSGRVSELTEWDINVLSQRGLNIEKAVFVKPYWARGFSRSQISSLLSNVNGQKVSGFSVSTIGSICAAFSSALSQIQDETA